MSKSHELTCSNRRVKKEHKEKKEHEKFNHLRPDGEDGIKKEENIGVRARKRRFGGRYVMGRC